MHASKHPRFAEHCRRLSAARLVTAADFGSGRLCGTGIPARRHRPDGNTDLIHGNRIGAAIFIAALVANWLSSMQAGAGLHWALPVSALGAYMQVHIELVAEEVETEEQKSYPASRSCHLMQGFLFARHITEEVFSQFMTTHRLKT